MPRRSSSQPRKGGGKRWSGPPSSGVASSARSGSLKQLLGGLSADMSLGDLVKYGADNAEAAARAAARAAGKTAAQVRGAARAARAAAIRASASRAGVTATTARRWAQGKQAPKAATASAARRKESRVLGGAAAIRSGRLGAVKSFGMGTVTVAISSGGSVGLEQRDMGHVTPDAGRLGEAAALMESGDEAGAIEVLSDALLEAYGEGMSGFMTIVDIPDPHLFF